MGRADTHRNRKDRLWGGRSRRDEGPLILMWKALAYQSPSKPNTLENYIGRLCCITIDRLEEDSLRVYILVYHLWWFGLCHQHPSERGHRRDRVYFREQAATSKVDGMKDGTTEACKQALIIV